MKYLRSAIEHLSRGVELERRLPKRLGGARISVSPDSALRYWYRNLDKVDPKLLKAAEELVSPGDVVWDVGANVGLFAFSAAGLAGERGRVLAIEPDAWLASLLHRSASWSKPGAAQVDVLPIAVSDEIRVANLMIAARGRSSNHLSGGGNSQSGGVRGAQSTLCVTLDWLLDVYPPPDVLKIDVEGVEISVLGGARRILCEARPRIFCEVRKGNGESIIAILRDAGYSVFDADVPKSLREPLGVAAWNSIAYPQDRQIRPAGDK
jgi:FkbM family methyltransferase